MKKSTKKGGEILQPELPKPKSTKKK